VLSDRKGINRQGGGLSAPALTDKDIADIRVAAEIDADFLGCRSRRMLPTCCWRAG
jgi:pyruvate kinase